MGIRGVVRKLKPQPGQIWLEGWGKPGMDTPQCPEASAQPRSFPGCVPTPPHPPTALLPSLLPTPGPTLPQLPVHTPPTPTHMHTRM